VIDTCGFKKDGFYFYQSQWTPTPMLHMFPHWNWKGKEGQMIPVTCYTNCDTVELFLNGRSLGIKGYEFPRLGMEGTYGNYPERARVIRTTADLHLTWDVPYEAGTLKAVGIKDGKIAATGQVVTTGDAVRLAISVDRQTLRADRHDVVHITVAVQDGHGNLLLTADHDVDFQVEGEGRLIGVDNGDPFNHEPYQANRRRAFNGLCLGIVQSTERRGAIRVIVRSPSLQSAEVALGTI
jgi:beta-galactosidase